MNEPNNTTKKTGSEWVRFGVNLIHIAVLVLVLPILFVLQESYIYQYFLITILIGISIAAYLKPIPLLKTWRTGKVAILLFFALGSFLMISEKRNEQRLTELRATNPQAYLEEIKTKSLEKWFSELEILDPKAHKVEKTRRIEKETTEILAKLKNIPVEQYQENEELYAKLLKLHPKHKKYQAKHRFYEEKIRQERAAAARQENIKGQFSVWDGSHRNLVKSVKGRLHDPDSFKHYQTTYSVSDNLLFVKMEYGAHNLFGAMVRESVTAIVSIETGLVLKTSEQ